MQTSPSDRVGLIDADILRYEIGSIEGKHPFLPDGKIPLPFDQVKDLLYKHRLHKMRKRLGLTKMICFLSEGDNFRDEVATLEPYKGNREGLTKPYNWSTVSELLHSSFKNLCLSNNNEADDQVALAAQILRSRDVPHVICSRDKDLDMIQGHHYRWKAGENQPEREYHVDPTLGELFFCKQLLTGDVSVDNIMGCGQRVDAMRKGQPIRKRQGIGSKKADKILGDLPPSAAYEVILDYYQLEFGDDALMRLNEMGQLLYIGQTEDHRWSYETRGEFFNG